MIFWLIAAAVAATAVWVLLAPLRAQPPAQSTGDSADMRIYRDQLAEVDRDLARGTLDAGEAARLRTEVQRRLLDADRAHQQAVVAAGAPVGSLRVLTVAVPLALIGGALALYATLGAPGARDFSMQDRLALAEQMNNARPSQADAEAAAPNREVAGTDPKFLDLMTQLRAAVADHQDDLQGHQLLALNEAVLGRYAAAAAAQANVVRLKGNAATASDVAEHAGLMILAADGIVSPEAEQVVIRALQMDPSHGVARYYAGLLHAQVGRPDRAFQMWRSPLSEGGADTPWDAPIRAQIIDVARAAGVSYTPPPIAQQRGPSAADIAAAADMSAEDRDAMIRGMVDGLSERLATEGGPASDWARLIGALGVLGEVARAAEIYAEAREVFAANPNDLALLARTASQAGITE
ncbi:MAG: c-type cytochrome biogenesis protein CcmI [Rhodobacteraceae bacterium]|nr:c-type cytochrome biogenesis protein CcmI [Paracoccaceae bacterium]